MEFLVSTVDDFRLEEIYRSYANTFPEDERRSETQFRKLLNHPKAKVISLLHDATFVGYLILWELSESVFVEHLEIFPQYRNQNLGSTVFKYLFQEYSKIILESEPEFWHEEASRRIKFYLRNGFQVIDNEYIQPAYEPEKNAVALWLLANFQPGKKNVMIEEIYDVVYSKIF